MVIWVEKVVGVHEGDHLLEHGPLQHLAQYGEDGNWSVVFGIKFAAFTFVERNNFGYFLLSWKLI